MSPAPMPLSEFVAFARAHHLAVVSTTDPVRGPEAALVDLAVTDAGELLFDTRIDARKVANLAHDPRAAMVIGWEGVSLQVEGQAAPVPAEDFERYADVHAAGFPGSRARREGWTLICLQPRWVRRHDATTKPPTKVEGDVDWA